ncbi:MAG: hypothetical protein ACLFPL_05060 [Candidatus Nanoarchaeia archaeon]
MVEHVFNTHSFLFLLSSQHPLANYSLIYLNSNNIEEILRFKQVIVTPSHISCKIVTPDEKTKTLNIFRIRKIFKGDEVVWDNSEQDLSNTKTIQGY